MTTNSQGTNFDIQFDASLRSAQQSDIPVLFAEYALFYLEQYRADSNDDLHKARQLIEKVVKSTINNSEDFAYVHECYANILWTHYDRFGLFDDLERAIGVMQKVAKVTPEDSPDFVGRLNDLGNGLQIRFERKGGIEDLEEAIEVQ